MYSVKYPSMRDNNILRRVLVGEVLFWTQRLRSRWESDKSFERDKDCTRNEGERGGNDCLSVQHEEAREEQTGENQMVKTFLCCLFDVLFMLFI